MGIQHPGLRLRTLGELRLLRAGGDQVAARRRELVLLAYLLRRSPQPVPRTELATVFWGDRPEVRARHSLRQALSQLRRLIGDLLEVEPEVVSVRAGSIDWDLEEVESWLRSGELEAALERCTGPLLPEADDRACEGLASWIGAEREALRRRLDAALDALVTRAESRGDWTDAARWAARWTELAPFQEEPERRRIEALVLGGRRSDALACHGRYVRLLAESMGEAPSAGFLRLGEQLRAAGPTGPVDDRAGPGSPCWRRFVGRRSEFASLVEAWHQAREGDGGLVVVAGAEGVGKSRLCEEFLAWLEARGGECFIMQARPTDSHGADAWTSARELLAALPAAPGLSGSPADALATLATLVPGLRELYPDLPAREPERPDEMEVRAAVERVVDDIAFEVPVLVLVDHVSRADPATRRALRALAAPNVARRAMVLVTGRPAELASCPELQDLPAGLPRRTLELAPLDAAAVEALLAGLDAEPAAKRAIATHVHAESGGYPRYALELLEWQLEQGRITRTESGDLRVEDPDTVLVPGVPGPVAEMARRRLDRLGPPACAMLAAAVSAPDGWRPADGPLPERLDPAAVPGLLQQLVGAGFLEPAEEGFAFRVPLVRRAVAALLPGPAARPPDRRAPREATRRARRRPAGWIAAVVALFVLLIAGVQHLARAERSERSAEAAVSSTKVAVFPFAVRGEALDYLGDGMVDLLSVNLAGAGDLRTVNRHALLRFLHEQPTDRLDAEAAARIARRFGAGTFVLGSVLGSGDRLRILAELHDPARGPDPVSRASVEGSADDLLELVDRLSTTLLGGWSEEGGARMAGLAARTTGSLSALKAYLRGEHHLRQGRFAAAVGAFQEAVREDSSFALAHFRLGAAAEWAMLYDEARPAMQAAVRHASRLPARERLLLQATLATNRGAADEAENLVRSILAVDTDDSEAWFQLGEILFHYGPRAGGSIEEAQIAFERTLEFEPRHLPALVHLARIAAHQRRPDQVEELAGRVLALSADGDPAWEMRALRTAVHGLPSEPLLARMRGAEPERIVVAAWSTAVYAGELGLALELARLLNRADYPSPWWSIGHVLVAQLEAARGRPTAAAGALAELSRIDRAAGVKYSALFAALPYMSASDAHLRRIHDDLRAWNPAQLPPPRPAHGLFSIHVGLQPHLREFLLGLVEVRLGDLDAADLRADRLLTLPVRSSEDHALVNDLTRTVRGSATLARGRAEQAAAILEHDTEVWYQRAVVSPFYSRAFQRFVRAGALAEAGRERDALADYRSFDGQAIHDLVYLAPSHLRRAEIYDRLGDTDRARHHLARFAELWDDAEPPLQPLVHDARERLESL